jgi:ArsR family transcriptional regulator
MVLNTIVNTEIETQSYDLQVQIFKVLTHPARLAILEILRDGEHCVCHMEAYLGFRQAYISQQLAVMREAGLIQDRRDGWNIFYRVADVRIYDVLDAVQRITGQSAPEVKKPGVNCTCPHCSSLAVMSSK